MQALTRSFQAAGGPSFDPMVAPWPAIAELTPKVLGGDFQAANPGHRLFQLRLGALFGIRLAQDAGLLWFRKRDTVGGHALGARGAVFTVSPFHVAALALVSGKLAGLEGVAADLQRATEAAAAKSPAPKPLTAHDYERFYDPAFLEFFALDRERATRAWNANPRALGAELKDAAFRAKPSHATRDWFESRLIFPLMALAPDRPLIEQADRDLPLFERVGELFGGVYGTGLLLEDGWAKTALPLLSLDLAHPAKAPALAKPALAKALESGQLLAAFLAQAPRASGLPAEGVLGLFEPDQLSAPDPRLAQATELRLFRVNPRPLLPLLQRFDPTAVGTWVDVFAHVLGPSAKLTPQETAVLEGSLAWLKRLQDTLALAVRDGLDFCLRRAPESEGQTGEGKGALREAVQAA